VAGWIIRGAYDDIWPNNPDYAIQMVQDMLAQLGTLYDQCEPSEIEVTEMPVGTIFHCVDPNLDNEFFLLMNGQSVVAADYPELAAVVPSAWLAGALIALPDMNGEEASLIADDTAQAAMQGSNNVSVSGFASHSHTFDQWDFQVVNVAPGGNQIAALKVPLISQATDSTGNAAQTDVRGRRLGVPAYIVAKAIDEVIPQGPPGPAGPAGPQGPLGDCSSCPEPIPSSPDDVANTSTDGLLPLAQLCAGSRAAAEQFVEEVLQFLDTIEAIAEGTELAPVFGIFRKLKPAWFRIIDASTLLAVTALRSAYDENYIDDLTCTIYCQTLKYGNLTPEAFDAIKTELGAFGGVLNDPVASFVAFPTAQDLTSWLLAYGIEYTNIVNEYNEGAVNEDAFCEAFCSCDQCDPVGSNLLVSVFGNPDIEIVTPFVDNGSSVTFAAGTWRQIILQWTDNAPRCVLAIEGEVLRSVTSNEPRYFAGRAGAITDTDDNGGTTGNNAFDLQFTGGAEAVSFYFGADTDISNEYTVLPLTISKAALQVLIRV